MDINFTLHAKEQIEERKILKIWIEEGLKWSDLTIRLEGGKYAVRKRLNGRSIEIIFIRERDIKILTVYWI